MRVYADHFNDGLEATVQAAMDWIDWARLVTPDARVFLKPNLTYPFYKPGVTTSPAVLEGLIRVLQKRTRNITIGESDGGSHAWSAEQAFEGHGLPRMQSEYGVQLVNLSRIPRERAQTIVAGRSVAIELPTLLLHEVDVFITVPVPKVHAMTGVSLGHKNQWGCIPDVKRLRYHHAFDRIVLAVNKLVRPRIAVFDGTYFLNRSGPMAGDPVEMNLVVVSDDVGGGSLACCEIMQIDAAQIPHLALAMREGLCPSSLEQVLMNRPLKELQREPFVLQRSLLHWVTLGTFRSRATTWLLYNSAMAKPAHNLLYLLRGHPKDFAPRW